MFLDPIWPLYQSYIQEPYESDMNKKDDKKSYTCNFFSDFIFNQIITKRRRPIISSLFFLYQVACDGVDPPRGKPCRSLSRQVY